MARSRWCNGQCHEYPQNQSGLDQSGNLGKAFFSVGGVGVLPNSSNGGAATVTATVSNANAVTADNYLLEYNGTQWALSDTTTGTSVTMGGSGTSGSPFTAAGLSIVVAGGAAQAGDSYLIEPTSGVVNGMKVLLTSPSQVAAAAPLLTGAGASNTGSGTINQGTVVAGFTPHDYTLTFTSANTYKVTDNTAGTTVVASAAYTSGNPITFNGLTVSVSGTPASGDSFSIDNNASGTGDNRQCARDGGPARSGTDRRHHLDQQCGQPAGNPRIGVQTNQAQTASTAQQAVLTDASNAQQSVSGVNLDEEAANLVQYQQAYQAAAEVIKVASSLFQSLLSAVQSG